MLRLMEKYRFDIVVAGGGLSGTTAAIAAARCGRSVALVERTDTLGGMATLALVSPMQTFHAPRGQVVRGIGQEIVSRLEARNASMGHIPDPIGFVETLTPFDPAALECLLAEMCREAGVALFLRHRMTDIIPGEDGRIAGIVAEAPDGSAEFRAAAFVDASGNGEITFASGAPMEMDSGHQPMSLMFMLGGARPEEIIAYQKSHPEEFHMTADMSVIDRGYVAVSGFFTAVREGIAAGEFTIPRDRLLFFHTMRPDCFLINTTRITGIAGLTLDELAAARETGMEQVRQVAAFMKKRIPGFQDSRIAQVAREVGVRETRRLLGRYILNENELIYSANFDDCIAKGAYPLDIHRQNSSGITTLELKEKLF